MKKNSNRSEDSDDDVDDDNAVVLPDIPNKKLVSKEKYASAVNDYIVAISKLSQFASETYVRCISPTYGERKSLDKLMADARYLETIYNDVVNYAFIQSGRDDFTEVFLCKSKREDVLRKTSLRTHLFWEVCKLRWSLRRTRRYVEDAFENRARDKQKKTQRREAYVSELTELNVCLYPERDPNEFTQRELDQAFFLLSGCWKTVDYSPTLSKYVNLLMDRTCEFFCFSMSCDEMDDEELRQPLPMDMLPRQKQLRPRQCDEREDPRQYAPNFDFVIMCQMRFFNFLSDLALYENREKRDLTSALKVQLAKCIRTKNEQRNIFTNYESSSYLNVDLVKRFVLDSCRHVSPEQKEKTASRYVFSTFSRTDYEWLVYKQPVNLPSFADEFISKACKESEYTQVVERTRKTYAEILKDDAGDVKLTGFYEWCVLKNASRLFALHFDIFAGTIFNREEVREHSVFIFNNNKPLIVQFFSRYYVFYKGILYADDDAHRPLSDANINTKTIYNTLMLWICIMLNDFPTKKKSKAIEHTLKTKYAEYFKLEEMERCASEYNYRKSQSSRIQQCDKNTDRNGDVEMDDDGVPVMNKNKRAREEEEEEEEEEERATDGRSERQNVHDAYFEKAVNLPEEELDNLSECEKQKTGLYFF